MPRVPRDPPGGVVEWLMALVLKTSVPKGTVGSNPTPSVVIEQSIQNKQGPFNLNAMSSTDAKARSSNNGLTPIHSAITAVKLETH